MGVAHIRILNCFSFSISAQISNTWLEMEQEQLITASTQFPALNMCSRNPPKPNFEETSQSTKALNAAGHDPNSGSDHVSQ